jgi:predicted alpha/beta superfamily hydrolase
VFQRLMVMSPSVWWDDFAILRLIDAQEQKPPLKIWLDTGTAEPGWEQGRELVNRLLEKGWKLQKDLQYMEAQGAEHSEAAWAARVEPALRFLFPTTK